MMEGAVVKISVSVSGFAVDLVRESASVGLCDENIEEGERMIVFRFHCE